MLRGDMTACGLAGRRCSKGDTMWPFAGRHRKPVVVVQIDPNGLAKGAFFLGDVDVLVVDERDPKSRVYRLDQETLPEDLRLKVGRHPLGRLLDNWTDAAS